MGAPVLSARIGPVRLVPCALAIVLVCGAGAASLYGASRAAAAALDGDAVAVATAPGAPAAEAQASIWRRAATAVADGSRSIAATLTASRRGESLMLFLLGGGLFTLAAGIRVAAARGAVGAGDGR